MAELRCRNVMCPRFDHLHKHNCLDWKTVDCKNFIEHKAKDPEKPTVPGINGNFLVVSSIGSTKLYKEQKDATDHADRHHSTQVFKIIRAAEYKKMGWVSGESYMGGVK